MTKAEQDSEQADNSDILHATPKTVRRKDTSVPFSQPDARQVGALSIEESKLVRARQDARSRVLGLILVGMAILFFAIAFVKIGLAK